MIPDRPAPAVFSTVGLPDARRVELWERHNATALIGLDVRTTAPLRATEINVQLSQIQLARVTGSAHVVERTARLVDRAPADAIAVYLSLRGESWFSSDGGTRLLRPGDVLICETDRPFERGFAHGLDELVVKVPRTALGPAATPFGPVGAGDHYAAALAKLAARATSTDCPVRADEQTVLELVRVLALGPRAARPAAHRAAARSFIEEHLTDPGLGADRVAAAIGISERHLSRVFATDGTSVPRYVLSRRLELAYAELRSGHGPETVADTAASCGFVSVTYFSHVFRERFGRRAGEMLREASHFRHPRAEL
jgi:AraC-like DNA-binding protein